MFPYFFSLGKLRPGNEKPLGNTYEVKIDIAYMNSRSFKTEYPHVPKREKSKKSQKMNAFYC